MARVNSNCHHTIFRQHKIYFKTPTINEKMHFSLRKNTSAIRQFIQNEIEKNDVVIFSKSYCPFCAQTKETFNAMAPGAKVKVIELDVVENGDKIQNELRKMTGQRTVPNVFVNRKHIGGNDDTQMLAESGKLQELLDAKNTMTAKKKMYDSETTITEDMESIYEA